MRTSIFYFSSIGFLLLGVLCYSKFTPLSIVFLGVGVLLLGIGIGGTITNNIWKKYDEAKEVIKSLLNS
jgi:hypothetical protein